MTYNQINIREYIFYDMSKKLMCSVFNQTSNRVTVKVAAVDNNVRRLVINNVGLQVCNTVKIQIKTT